MKSKHLFFYTILFLSLSTIQAQHNKYVDLFIGTSGDNGQVDPAACVPYGMVRVCPDMNPRSHSGYDYSVNSISGFSINRLSGIGCGGNGGNLSLKPAQKGVELKLIKSTEHAFPGYYSVTLDNGVRNEFTATQNVAAERFYFSKDKEAVMTLDVASSFTTVREAEFKVISDTEIQGFVKTGTTCDAGDYKIYFNLKTNRPFKEVSRTNHLFEFSFGVGNNKPVEIRLAISPIDALTAKQENERVSDLSFEKIKVSADKLWEDLLEKIEVKGGSQDDRVIFYTSLYRSFLSPMNVTSWNKKFLATDGTIQTAKDFTYYSSWSMWDSYRTKFPLITLLEPEKMRDMCKSLSRLYVYGKKGWATPYESSPTVRTEHTIATLLDAYEKGISDIDLELAYEGLKKEVDALGTKRPDQAFETCVDLWSMSRIANIQGNSQDTKNYGEKADKLFKASWEKEFMNPDDSYAKMRNNGLYQGSRWQYRWLLPQYLDEMTKSVGGKKVLAEQLEYFFANSLNNQGNEVSLHAPLILNRLDRPDLAQSVITTMLTKETKHLYGGNAEYPKPIYSKIFKRDPKGFLPEMDEDDGTMSSWYVLASMGLFPLTIGEPWYEITSPLFDKVILKLNGGKKLEIQTKNRKSAEDKIKNVQFNERKVLDFKLNHNQLVKGGVLELLY